MRCFPVILLLNILSFSAHAQISDTARWNLIFNGTGNINKTNDGTSFIFNNALRANFNKKYLNINTLHSWIYGENPVRKTNNDFISSLDADLFKNKHRLYYWVLASWEKSFSLKLDHRFQTGAGAGYKIINQKKASLVLTDGLLYETSQLTDPDQYGRLNYQTLRNSFRIKHKFLVADLINIDGTHFLQNSLSDKTDYIIRSHTTISFKLNKWLSLSTTMVYNKLNLTKKENYLFSYGLMVEKNL